jgi:hypothetical protein
MNSGFECRDWQVAHPFLATENGCPTLSPVSSRKGWETPAPTRPHPGSHPSRFRAFFQARTGRRQLAPPQVAEGSWPHRRWCLQRITLPARTMKTCGSIPVPGRETESTQRGTPPPWGVHSPFLRFSGEIPGPIYLLFCDLPTYKQAGLLTGRTLSHSINPMESMRRLEPALRIIGHCS